MCSCAHGACRCRIGRRKAAGLWPKVMVLCRYYRVLSPFDPLIRSHPFSWECLLTVYRYCSEAANLSWENRYRSPPGWAVFLRNLYLVNVFLFKVSLAGCWYSIARILWECIFKTVSCLGAVPATWAGGQTGRHVGRYSGAAFLSDENIPLTVSCLGAVPATWAGGQTGRHAGRCSGAAYQRAQGQEPQGQFSAKIFPFLLWKLWDFYFTFKCFLLWPSFNVLLD
jgi:hypothetical protein